MFSMNCYECVFKHIATALSFGKQILSGHGKGSDLDHRIDFLGELVNLQQHLDLINQDFGKDVKNYRQALQQRKINLIEQDLQFLRALYQKVQEYQESMINKKTIFENINLSSPPSILFLHITNKNYFDLCYKKLKENLRDYKNIYYLKSDVDLTQFDDVKSINYTDIQDDYLYIMNEKTVILKPVSCKYKMRIYDYNMGQFNVQKIMMDLKKTQTFYFYERYPIIVQKNKFEEFLSNELPLTYYANKYKDSEQRSYNAVVKLDKVLCCSNKSKIQSSAIFCYVENDVALNSLKNYLKI